jgi:hypothetical protein
VAPAPDAPEGKSEAESESAWLLYWHAQPDSTLFLIAAVGGCTIAFPLLDIFPEGFGLLRQIAVGAFIGLGFGMLPIAHRIRD